MKNIPEKFAEHLRGTCFLDPQDPDYQAILSGAIKLRMTKGAVRIDEEGSTRYFYQGREIIYSPSISGNQWLVGLDEFKSLGLAIDHIEQMTRRQYRR